LVYHLLCKALVAFLLSKDIPAVASSSSNTLLHSSTTIQPNNNSTHSSNSNREDISSIRVTIRTTEVRLHLPDRLVGE
jgi:hypothetical protein